MKLPEVISRIRIVTDVLLSRLNTKVCDNKTVLIVFQQIYGDSILIQGFLEMYARIYPKSEGFKLIFIARPSILKFMKETMPVPDEISYEELDFKKFLSSYGYFKTVIGNYRNKAGTIIIPGTSLSAEIFSCLVNAKRKIGLIRSMKLKKPLIRALISKIAYNETVIPDKNEMMLERHCKLLKYLGLKDCKSKLPSLIPQPRVVQGRYAVICPGSSKSEKCWPIEKFGKVADYLIAKYNLDIHLCGESGEEFYSTKLKTLVEQPQKIFSHIGETSYSKWSAIIQHAAIVIGNDSASLHMAVAGRVPSICISGVYDKYQFFPYKVDVLGKGDLLPITVMTDQPCKWCRTIGYYAGYKNPDCRRLIQQGKSALCLERISELKVMDATDQALSNFLNDMKTNNCNAEICCN